MAHRVAALERILNEKILALDDRIQVMDFSIKESNQAMNVKLVRLNELSRHF